eukprot:284291-Amorphochlora_amoeboformis.AAC.1
MNPRDYTWIETIRRLRNGVDCINSLLKTSVLWNLRLLAYQADVERSDLAVNKKTLLYVGGLEEQVDEKTVHAAFVPFGEVVHIELPRDQLTHHHRGFAFVEFEEPEDAAHAIENMNDSELFGRVLKVNHARPSAMSREGGHPTKNA